MSDVIEGEATCEDDPLSQWRRMLRDEATLLACPGAHHKALLNQAHLLHLHQEIDRDGLCDLLELADGVLAYAVETMLDFENDE
ncbi:hypothetical protein [Pseudomonas sp. B21-048]|uniref:hypothetical protein n=1 Tax=Pseudomonas sp. B21-048 TaxID=2895490 RepID=UPI00215E61F0|nr:hypothetical protein [Pseudomonas sp. B21-048]UVL00489.1 hypothetical protein LOY56_09035 [Pseudomonas sp. B21-048]